MNRQLYHGWDFPAMPDFDMMMTAHNVAKDPKLAPVLKKAGCTVHVGSVFTTDYFYHPQEDQVFHSLGKHNILGLEMETAALYGMAPQHGAKVLSMSQ